MRTRWFGSVAHPVRMWTAALMVAAGGLGAHASEDDTFFRDLDRAEALTGAPDLTALRVVPQAGPTVAVPAKAPDTRLPNAPPPTGSVAAPRAASIQPAAPVPSPGERDLPWDATTGTNTQRETPGSAAGPPDHAAPARSANAAADPLSKRGLDPEPDAVVKVPVPAASQDPLDRPMAIPSHATPAAPQNEPLPPLHAALKTLLDRRGSADGRGTAAAERRKEHDAVAFFYASHGFGLIWSRDGKAIEAVESVLSRLAAAGDDALRLGTVPASLRTQGRDEEVAESELALTEAVVAYARQATGSRVDPRNVSPLIGLRPVLADPAEVLEMLVASGSAAGDKLQGLNPQDPRYRALRDKLVSLRAARRPEVSKPISAGPMLHVGMRDARVPLLRERFHLMAVQPGSRDELRYDPQVASAVAEYQRANELPPSGALTAATLAALSGTVAPRSEASIVTNMEMWRWMPRDLGANRIEVNVPDYIVTVFRDGAPVSQNRVVVGKTDTPTPLFSNSMKYLIVNPYWNVPQSIIKKEMLPKAGGDLSYLNGRGYSAVWHGGQWVVKQLPGTRNALGRIKFLFPNDYSVYLHDTPSKALFSASRRAFSHGCVRVDQPFAFGASVLNDALPEGARKRWNEAHLEDLIGEKERYINLPVALPIHIAYFTAAIDPASGHLTEREDIYGYAHAVTAALSGEGGFPVAMGRTPKLVADHPRKAAAAAAVAPFEALDPR